MPSFPVDAVFLMDAVFLFLFVVQLCMVGQLVHLDRNALCDSMRFETASVASSEKVFQPSIC